jgi:hypothetical protein
MSDLSDLDRETLKLGTVQWLPVRDRAGRAVFCMPATKMNLEETRTRVRVFICPSCFVFFVQGGRERMGPNGWRKLDGFRSTEMTHW